MTQRDKGGKINLREEKKTYSKDKHDRLVVPLDRHGMI